MVVTGGGGGGGGGGCDAAGAGRARACVCVCVAHRSPRDLLGGIVQNGFKVVVSTIYNPDEIWQCRFCVRRRRLLRRRPAPNEYITQLHIHTTTMIIIIIIKKYDKNDKIWIFDIAVGAESCPPRTHFTLISLIETAVYHNSVQRFLF